MQQQFENFRLMQGYCFLVLKILIPPVCLIVEVKGVPIPKKEKEKQEKDQRQRRGRKGKYSHQKNSILSISTY